MNIKLLPILASAAIFLSGCAAHRIVQHPAPSFVPLQSNVEKAKAGIKAAKAASAKAKDAITRSQVAAKQLLDDTASAPATKSVVLQLQSDLDDAQKQIGWLQDQQAATEAALEQASNATIPALQKQVETQTNDLNTAVQNLDKALVERDAAKSEALKQTKLAWKWRLITLGLALLVAAFFVARQYFPFLKLI